MAILEEVRSAIQSVTDEVGPAVVGIGHRWALGSGVVVAPRRIVTNAHNVRGPEVTVSLPGGDTVSARVLGVEVDADVALLEVDADGLVPVRWEDGAELSIGTPVFALANPGGRGLRVTFGFVTGTERSFRGPRGRQIRGSLEHTAPLLPGSSGGPIVDEQGRFAGLNTNRLGEGFYLAIPADSALKERIDRLASGTAPRTRRLGIAVAPPEVAARLRRAVGLPDAEGLLVRGIKEDGPAARAGMREGDLLTEAGGRALTTADELFDVLDSAGSQLEVRVVRGVEELTLTIDLDV
jgi:serine protease Do